MAVDLPCKTLWTKSFVGLCSKPSKASKSDAKQKKPKRSAKKKSDEDMTDEVRVLCYQRSCVVYRKGEEHFSHQSCLVLMVSMPTSSAVDKQCVNESQ